MSIRLQSLLIVAVFSLAVSHLFLQVFSVPTGNEYVVTNKAPLLSSPTPNVKQLYLRRALHLAERPQTAWIQVLGRDSIDLYVNGKLVERDNSDGFPVAILADISDRLQVGKNTVAIASRHSSSRQPPRIGVDGGYILRGIEHPIEADGLWRASTLFERSNAYWLTSDFDDHDWPLARETDDRLRAVVSLPPRAVRTASEAAWISADTDQSGWATFRKAFTVHRRPLQAWMRIASPLPYRIVINERIVEAQPSEPASWSQPPAVEKLYDLSPWLQRGNNLIALAVKNPTGSILARINGEIYWESGSRIRLDSDPSWKTSAGLPGDWYRKTPAFPTDWRSSRINSTLSGPVPDHVTVRLAAPPNWRVRLFPYVLYWMGMAIPIAAITYWTLRKLHSSLVKNVTAIAIPSYVIFVTLAPVVIAVGFMELAVWDPRVARTDVFRLSWLLAILSVLPLQWLLLYRAQLLPASIANSAQLRASGRLWSTLLLAAMVTAGTWMRLAGIDDSPLHHDEVRVFQAAQGFLERGFPSLELHGNVPISYKATSELTYVPAALLALFVDRDYLIVRLPGVVWSVLTILVLYRFGARIFGRSVGLAASALYAFAPMVVDMSTFGRYFSQLQFFTLATVYCLYVALDTSGRLDRRWIWLTTISFVATYLSWEGSALMVPGILLAALVLRPRTFRLALSDKHVWLAGASVVAVVLLQHAHRVLQQSHRLWFGSGASDVSVTLMSSYPGFEPGFYLWASSWSQDALFPMLGLIGAGLFAFQSKHRRPIRFLLAFYLTSCLLMILLLPVRAARYGYQFTPFLILLDSVFLVVIARNARDGIIRFWESSPPRWWRGYARGLSSLFVAASVCVASGAIIRDSDPGWLRGGIPRPVIPDHPAAVAFLDEQLKEGDLVLATMPHVVEHYSGRPTDYWLQTRHRLQAVLDDKTTQLRNRTIGTAMIPSLKNLEDLFARYRRIWYVAVPQSHDNVNESWVSAYLRANMDVAFEAQGCLVLFHAEQIRPPQLSDGDERALRRARTNYLP